MRVAKAGKKSPVNGARNGLAVRFPGLKSWATENGLVA